jgi:hypothetical protein
MYSANYKKPYVATYKEIVIGFVTFVLVLVVLYPKDMLQKQVLAEDANYDLSMLYLQNMLKNDPGNEVLMYSLAKQSLKGEKRTLAFKLLRLLKTAKDITIRKKAYLLSYKVAKENYYYLLKDQKFADAKKLKDEMNTILKEIVKYGYYTDKDLLKLYQEAEFVKDQKLSYFFVKKLLKKEPTNPHYLQSALYFAIKENKSKEALKYLNVLIRIEPQNAQKYKEEKYYILYNFVSKEAAHTFLLNEAKKSPLWMEKLAKFYLYERNYRASSRIYQQLFLTTENERKKEEYFLASLKALQAGNRLKDATKLGIRYQQEFLHNRRVRTFLLQLYISANELQHARSLALTILQMQLKKKR